MNTVVKIVAVVALTLAAVMPLPEGMPELKVKEPRWLRSLLRR